jgi:hypothetical protein
LEDRKMKKFVTLLLVALFASTAFAGLDDGADSFGVYFDTLGNTNDLDGVAVFTPFNVYLLLMNPTGPTNGFECTVTPVGAPHFILSTTLGGMGALDVDSSPNGFAVGAASDYPAVGGAMVLVTWSFMLQSPAQLEYYITKATIPSMPGNLPVVTGNGVLRRCGISSGSVLAPVAYVNSPNTPVVTETSSFGNVKSLFR